MRSNDDAQKTSSNRFSTLQASSSKPQLSSRKLQVSKSQTSKAQVPNHRAQAPCSRTQAPGLGAQAFSHRFHAAGPVGQAPSSRLGVQAAQILSPNTQTPCQTPSQVPSRIFHAPDSRPSPLPARQAEQQNGPGQPSFPKSSAKQRAASYSSSSQSGMNGL